jgi:hypothetical protein
LFLPSGWKDKSSRGQAEEVTVHAACPSLKLEAVRSSETSAKIVYVVRYHIIEKNILPFEPVHILTLYCSEVY